MSLLFVDRIFNTNDKDIYHQTLLCANIVFNLSMKGKY